MLQFPIYRDSQYLASRDLLDAQTYFLKRLRCGNRYLHGWGIVCGLRVVPAYDTRLPWGIRVCPGYALDPCGNEICISVARVVDVRDYLWLRPAVRNAPAAVAYVAIKYTEEPRGLVVKTVSRCGCNEPVYEPSRIRDSSQVDIVWSAPPKIDQAPTDICSDSTPLCPAPSSTPYMYLASVVLPTSEGDPLTASLIYNQ